MTPSVPRTDVTLQGVIISGGEDIAPDLYSGVLHGTAVSQDSTRDGFELQVLERALAARLPVLGICRGEQLINVALGGNLHKDLRTHRRRTSNQRTLLPCKTIALRPRSRLAAVTGLCRIRVNSLHHQSVARLGRGLSICAVDADAIVQAIESHTSQWLLGVQWHPEYLPYLPQQRRLFSSLVAACTAS